MALKVEAKGGQTTGVGYDHGGNYNGIKKVYVYFDGTAIRYLKVDFDKAGQVESHEHGNKIGTQHEFVVNYPYEYIIFVEGSYAVTQPYGCIVLRSLTFKTSNGRTLAVGTVVGTKFLLESQGNGIVGFHGRVGACVDSIGAYFIKIPSTKTPMQGGQTTGVGYDHGGNYNGIKKLYVYFDGTAIRYLKVDFDKAGQVESHEHGYKIGTQHEFAVNYPYEYIISVEGSYAVTQPYGCIVLRSLTFKTSIGRTLVVGTVVGTKFVLQSQGNAIVGFHGRVGACVDSIGAYYIKIRSTKSPMQGGQTTGFVVNYPNEYITSVEGSYAVTQPYGCIVLRSLTFKTSNGRTLAVGTVVGTKFVLESQGNAIVGFHGRVGACVDSIGAYYIKIRSTKSPMQGGQTTGVGYDHGGDYDGIKKVYVSFDGTSIRYLRVDFEKDGQVECHEHGNKIGTQHEFVVNYPYEYITSVEGSYAVTQPYGCIVLRSLTFKTSKGRTLSVGTVVGTKFVLESQGNAIVGFHGRVGACVDSIGAYYAPPSPPPTPPSEKLEGQGGDGGASWDDGAFQNVKKIYIGQGQVGIVSVKFEYGNDASEVVVGHGKQTLLGYEVFELDYPSEYITSVEACHDKVMGAETGVITMLKFKTNKRTSPPFGLETAFNFVLQKEGHKITGFHGKSGDVLHKIGVHVVPITE